MGLLAALRPEPPPTPAELTTARCNILRAIGRIGTALDECLSLADEFLSLAAPTEAEVGRYDKLLRDAWEKAVDALDYRREWEAALAKAGA
jgi:hypothetical protein